MFGTKYVIAKSIRLWIFRRANNSRCFCQTGSQTKKKIFENFYLLKIKRCMISVQFNKFLDGVLLVDYLLGVNDFSFIGFLLNSLQGMFSLW